MFTHDVICRFFTRIAVLYQAVVAMQRKTCHTHHAHAELSNLTSSEISIIVTVFRATSNRLVPAVVRVRNIRLRFILRIGRSLNRGAAQKPHCQKFAGRDFETREPIAPARAQGTFKSYTGSRKPFDS